MSFENQGKKIQHKLFGPDFPVDVQTLRPNAWGSKVSPRQRGRRKADFLTRTSMVFGVDVHDPKGSRETLRRKRLR